MIRKLFRNARIFTPLDPGRPLSGKEQGKVTIFEKGAFLCRDGLIESLGFENDVLRYLGKEDVHQEVDLGGMCVIPGLVDSHTHICFVGHREGEFNQRLKGVPYLEILEKGGGILSTVRKVREASEERLFEETVKRIETALRLGTTCVEIKSGYGLDTENELKMLRVIERVDRTTSVDVVATFMGAHAVPWEYKEDPQAYVELLMEEMLPRVKEQGVAKFCDVFCESGVFSPDQTRGILTRASSMGFLCKIHADEVHDTGGAMLAAELGVTSAEHLLAASLVGLKAMAEKGTIAVLLPGTALSMRRPFARAREMISLGVPVALASDCNPGSCYLESMLMVFALGVLGMEMSVDEALVACTLNGAYAIGMGHTVGSLEPGKQGDFVVLKGDTPGVMAYRLGSPECVDSVYKRGERVA